MKIIFIAALMLSCLQTTEAQTNEGKITYEQKVDLHRRIPDDNPQMRAMLPPTRITKFELLFADNQSLFKAVVEEPDLAEPNHGGMMIRMNNGVENEYYKNFTTQKAVEKREMMETVYLVEDTIHSFTWKLEEGEKTIAGYTCKKASGKTERRADVIAWYTEVIPVTSGPEQFNGLPGMILGLDANKGEIVFTAILVDKKLDKKALKAPAKGKRITGPEFAKIQNEMMRRGPVRIVTN
ncbi:MAG: GLPGLI family protein [Ferruginibacter sp.]